MKNKLLNRILSSVLCVALILSMFPAVPFSVGAAGGNSGTEAVVTTDVETREGIDYEITRTTRYVGNRTYCVQVDISANLSTYDSARIRTAAKNGYITVQEDGWYLIEMWGGHGGNGQGAWSVSVIIPVYNEGGRGGNSGYVYGKMYLKAGQTLVYNIGTDGGQSIVKNDDGGGVNGDGGTHGEEGSLIVGGGGGYTAIYLFEEGEFKESYVTPTTISIPETARVSRVLMIAGGGGGGGAAFLDGLLNGSATGQANGGMGGNVNNGISVSLTGSGYTVPGYVFSGRNGQSSGTSTAYIGHGGSNVPGAVSSTLFDQFEQSALPNDWSGTYNTAALPGAGGSGNFRGGGGGSGYAGGSGGIMEAQFIAANVGGGGGGSSFIAEKVNGEAIQFLSLTEKEKAYLSGANNQPEGDGPGGAVQITFLEGVHDDFEALTKVKITGSVTKYFEILPSSRSSGVKGIQITENTNDTTFTATDLTIVPTSPAHGGTSASVTLYIKAKSDFMGGNSVDMMNYVQANFKSPKDNTTDITLKASESKEQSVVNVPLNAKMRTRSYTSSQEGKSYSESVLYYDDYSADRADLTQKPDSYYYISAISEYAVYEYNQSTGQWVADSNTTVSPTETTTYQVRYTVTPTTPADPEVKVGPALADVETVIGTAVISVVKAGTARLNGVLVTGVKDLQYADGNYLFSTIINQTTDAITVSNQMEPFTIAGSSTITVEQDGWYYIQVWGGNGGASGYGQIRGINGNQYERVDQAAGGAGGYVSGYYYLKQGQIVTYTVGSAGSSPGYRGEHQLTKSDKDYVLYCGAGQGGTYSSVQIDSEYVLIAGGGGGAGESVVSGAQSYNGITVNTVLFKSDPGDVPAKNTTVSGTLQSPLTDYYNGGAGKGGSGTADGAESIFQTNKATASGGAAGSVGSNYKNGSYTTTQQGQTLSEASQKYGNSLTTTKSVSGGQVTITLVENAEQKSELEKVYGLKTQTAFTKYFNVDEVELETGYTWYSKSTTKVNDTTYTKTYKDSSGAQIAKFTYEKIVTDESTVVTITELEYIPTVTTTDTATGYSVQYSSNLNITYTLTPKDGFLGGNDVPLLAYGQTGGVADKDTLPDCGVRITQDEDFMNLPAADPTDYANVEATVDLSQYLTVQDKTIHLGDSVEKSELYTFTPPTYGADDWRDDYVHFEAPSDDTYTPTQTTEYPITIGFAPNVTTAQKATIVGSLGVQEYTLYSTVYVQVPVRSTLTNMTYEGEEWTLWGEDFGCTLAPKPGYILPEEVSVTIGGAATTNFTYDKVTGTVSIDGQYVTGEIVISATAQVKTYNIHIVYTNYDPATGLDVEQPEVKISGIEADAVIDWSAYDAIKDAHNAKPGHEYHWTFETADGTQPTTMPANDLWVYGSYIKALYPLKIQYVMADGTTAPEPYEGLVVFGEKYTVTSPNVKGYLPDKSIVSGTMVEGGVVVTVTYEPSSNKLIVIYQKEDGTELGRDEISTVTNQTVTVNCPEFVGYETAEPSFSVTMDGDLTQTVFVTYTAKKFTVTFDPNMDGATLDGANTKQVEYDNIYSYNAESKSFDGMPTAQFAGYTFVGWYTDEEFTTEVKESDTVAITENVTLYAKWEKTKFKLTVRYDFFYEGGDYIPEGYANVDAVESFLVKYEQMYEFGESYSVNMPELKGYSAYSDFGLNSETKHDVYSGTMPGQNTLVVITFKINVYTINFRDLPGSYVTYSDAATSSEANDSFDTLWGTVQVKHDVSPDYSDVENPVTPNHAVREEYTYEFTSWYGFAAGEVYPEFPKATQDATYYATYRATENIVIVTFTGTTRYFTNIADAIEFAEENLSSYAVTMKFRRNTGNPTEINLNTDRLVFGQTFGDGTPNGITLNLNGLRLVNTLGQTAIENNLKAIPLTITDSGAGGRILVEGEGDVVAVQATAGNLTVSSAIRIEAVSTDGNATGIRFGKTGGTLTLPAYSSVIATANAGTAVGIDVLNNATVSVVNLTVSGKDAIGIQVQDGATATLSGANLAMTVKGVDFAMGIHVLSGGALTNTAANSNQQTVTASVGNAYGIYNEGTVNSLNLKMTVNAAENAYGLYNNIGTVTVSGIQGGTDLRASGSVGGYGLYNVTGGVIGSADGSKLQTGAFAGSSYGIYSEDGGTIYASGNKVYFKGGVDNLRGVEHEGYDETSADEQFEPGYFRLAAMRTIIFVTNGGTEIATITQYYDTPLAAVVTTKRGYTFVDWHKTEALDSAYTYPERMPDEDLSLYTEWSLNQYYYSLDKEFKEVKIYFNYRQPAGTTTVETVMLTEDNPILELPPDGTFHYSSYVYVQSGWYTSTTPSYSTRVDFSGDISRYAVYSETEGCYVLNLYGGWEKSPSTLYSNSTSYYKKIGTDSANPATARITSSYQSSSAYYMYYQVPASGDYTINVKNTPATSSGTNKYAYVYKYVPDSSTSHSTYTYKSVSANSTWTYTFSNMKPGDVLVVKFYRTGSSNTASDMSCYITSTADLVAEGSKQATSGYYEKPIEYNVEMGTVTLPIADSTGHEDMKFAGWAENETADRIMEIRPEMVDTVAQWQNGELWQLYSQWTERTWAAYKSGIRDFTAFENTAQVTIRGNETVSLRFTSENMPAEALSFKFANGLTAGTILTLIDRSGDIPAYYTYTVDAETTELSSTVFTKMGEATTHFGGFSTDVVLQICYQNKILLDTETETVSIFAGDVVSEVDAVYDVELYISQELPDGNGSTEFEYSDTHSFNISGISLDGVNLPQNYRVFLRVRWDNLDLAPGTVITFLGTPATIYGGKYAILDTGATVQEVTGEIGGTIEIKLPTMVQNEFQDKTFYYELCIAPDLDNAFGEGVWTVLSMADVLTLKETPSLEVGSVDIEAPMGGQLSVNISSPDAEIYLYQQNSDGTFLYNANCATVFDGLTIDENGKLSIANGTLITDGVFSAAVSDNALRGKYYLVVKLGDKYERILLRIVNAPQETTEEPTQETT